MKLEIQNNEENKGLVVKFNASVQELMTTSHEVSYMASRISGLEITLKELEKEYSAIVSARRDADNRLAELNRAVIYIRAKGDKIENAEILLHNIEEDQKECKEIIESKGLALLKCEELIRNNVEQTKALKKDLIALKSLRDEAEGKVRFLTKVVEDAVGKNLYAEFLIKQVQDESVLGFTGLHIHDLKLEIAGTKREEMGEFEY